jgi:hypothetical protein
MAANLTVPVEIVEYAYSRGLLKPLAIFLYLKITIGDKIKGDNHVFDTLRVDLKMKDIRSFNKHMSELLALKWVSHNKVTNVFHVRSFNKVRIQFGFKDRQACITTLHDIRQIQTFAVGVLINVVIRKQRYFFERIKGRTRTATLEGPVAKQSRAPRRTSFPEYYGLTNRKLSKLLGCKQTRACVLKNAAARAGYLEVKHRYLDLKEFTKPDYHYRRVLSTMDPALARRIRFFSKREGDKKVVKAVQQLRDELIPKMVFKKICPLNSTMKAQ